MGTGGEGRASAASDAVLRRLVASSTDSHIRFGRVRNLDNDRAGMGNVPRADYGIRRVADPRLLRRTGVMRQIDRVCPSTRGAVIVVRLTSLV